MQPRREQSKKGRWMRSCRMGRCTKMASTARLGDLARPVVLSVECCVVCCVVCCCVVCCVCCVLCVLLCCCVVVCVVCCVVCGVWCVLCVGMVIVGWLGRACTALHWTHLLPHVGSGDTTVSFFVFARARCLARLLCPSFCCFNSPMRRPQNGVGTT